MKKLMLGLMMAFAATAEAYIDGIDYNFNFDGTATIMDYDRRNPPTKVDVAEVEDDWGGKYIVTSVGMSAFTGCDSLTSVYLPKATTIGENAFQGCGLTSVYLPNATTIGQGAFDSCGLTSVSLPNATTIGNSAFGGCENLKEVSLPNVTTIEQGAFDACRNLPSVSLPNATTIGLFAFRDCENLKEVSLPSVTTIGEAAFSGCQGLSSLLVNAEMKKEIEDKGKEAYGIPQAATITCYDGYSYSVLEKAEYQMTMTMKSGDTAIDEDKYKKSCEILGLTPKEKPQVVKEGEIAVKKESIAAPSAGTVKVEDNKVQLGVTVLKTSDLTAEKKTWDKVKITKDDIDVDADGNIIVNVPVDSASGFMILQSKDAKIETAE